MDSGKLFEVIFMCLKNKGGIICHYCWPNAGCQVHVALGYLEDLAEGRPQHPRKLCRHARADRACPL